MNASKGNILWPQFLAINRVVASKSERTSEERSPFLVLLSKKSRCVRRLFFFRWLWIFCRSIAIFPRHPLPPNSPRSFFRSTFKSSGVQWHAGLERVSDPSDCFKKPEEASVLHAMSWAQACHLTFMLGPLLTVRYRSELYPIALAVWAYCVLEGIALWTSLCHWREATGAQFRKGLLKVKGYARRRLPLPVVQYRDFRNINSILEIFFSAIACLSKACGVLGLKKYGQATREEDWSTWTLLRFFIILILIGSFCLNKKCCSLVLSRRHVVLRRAISVNAGSRPLPYAVWWTETSSNPDTLPPQGRANSWIFCCFTFA